MGGTGMSGRELRRVEVLARVQAKELKLIDAASVVEVSYRQAKRLWKRYREEGLRFGRHPNDTTRSERKGDISNEVGKGTFPKRFDISRKLS